VYILATRSRRVIYVGVTGDLERRVGQHKAHEIPGFTARYNVDQLAHIEVFPSPDEAIAREKQIKGWSRAKKEALISASNPAWVDLSADWYSSGPAKS
jgi:putative endonuclease